MFRIFKSKEIFNEVSYGYARHKKKLCGEISLTYGMGPNPSSRSPCAVQRMRRQCPRASNPRAPSPCPPAHACPPLLGLSHFAAVPTSPEGPSRARRPRPPRLSEQGERPSRARRCRQAGARAPVERAPRARPASPGLHVPRPRASLGRAGLCCARLSYPRSHVA